MVESQREKLFTRTSEYLNIGITKHGEPRMTISVPWDRTANAFNMRTPDVYFAREDFDDPKIMEYLSNFHVLGCYIFTPLPDYDFLAQFTEIWDMYIEYGGAIQDLSFMRNMREWFMLYIEDAHLKDLNDLFPEDRIKYSLNSRCMGFYHCQVDDISAMLGKQIYLSELLIWAQEENPEEKAKWKAARAGRFRYCVPKKNNL